MKKNVFIDVGGHLGQTLDEVIKPYYNFDSILCFEPAREEHTHLLKKYTQESIEIYNLGLLDITGPISLFGSNDNMAKSIYKEKNDLIDSDKEEIIQVVDVSEFTREKLRYEDINIMKLNCEGSEFKILSRLMETGDIFAYDEIMIDFDIRKVPGMEYKADKTILRLRTMGLKNFSLAENVMIGDTHQDRIKHWLYGLPDKIKENIFL